MSLYSRARKHIDMKRVKEIREEKIKEQKISKLIERQLEIAAELKEIEREESKHCDWKKELEEGMTTAGLGMINLGAVGDVALDTVSNVTIDDSDAADPYQDYGSPDFAVTALVQSMGTIDTSKYDTLKLTISGSFNTRTVDGLLINDKVSIAVLINGTYAGNYLAQGLGAGTHVLSIPAHLRNPNMRFSAIKNTAIQGVSTPTLVSNIQFQRRTPMNLLVSLDDPEANSFIRGGLGGSEERKAKLKDMLEAGNELMIKLGLEPSKTTPGDIEIASETRRGLKPDGTQGYSKPGELNKGNDGKWYEYAPGGWVPIPTVDAGKQKTMVA